MAERPASYLMGFTCLKCGATQDPASVHTSCPVCGGNLDARYDYQALSRMRTASSIIGRTDRSMWHYAELLPANVPAGYSHTPLGAVGWSPLYRATAIERSLDIHTVWLKADFMLGSGSFKDRASAMVIARAMERGFTTIVVASTGNAAAALATLCAGTGIRSVIFVPIGTPEGKLAQALIHGATVYEVDGTYTDCVRLAHESSHKFGWYDRTTGVNPYTREGKKTAGFEIAEQLGDGLSFRAPDVMVVPVGDGNIISGVHKGFVELAKLGWVDRVPKFVGVTATLAPSLFHTWQAGNEILVEAPSSTIASGISVGFPEDGVAALRAVRTTGGLFVEAGDAEMLADEALLAREAGVFVEPASAAALTGLRKARALGAIRPSDAVVLQLTGSGLKDPQSAMRAAGKPIRVTRLDDVIG